MTNVALAQLEQAQKVETFRVRYEGLGMFTPVSVDAKEVRYQGPCSRAFVNVRYRVGPHRGLRMCTRVGYSVDDQVTWQEDVEMYWDDYGKVREGARTFDVPCDAVYGRTHKLWMWSCGYFDFGRGEAEAELYVVPAGRPPGPWPPPPQPSPSQPAYPPPQRQGAPPGAGLWEWLKLYLREPWVPLLVAVLFLALILALLR